jgi:hypothetical protein
MKQSKGPENFELLSRVDKDQYMKIREAFSGSSFKNQRNHSLDSFISSFDQIKKFVQSSEADLPKRALICEVYWLKDGSIEVNVK